MSGPGEWDPKHPKIADLWRIENRIKRGELKAGDIELPECFAKLGFDGRYMPSKKNVDYKYNELEKVLNDEHSNNGMVAFAGDGINDSPVLAISDIGFAMGGIGASSALEASDVVLMTDDLKKIISSIKISKYTNKIIIENLVFALSVKVIVLVLSMLCVAKMWQAVFADVGVTLLAIFNTIRILKYKP